MTMLGFLSLAIKHWSASGGAFAVSRGVGIVAMVLGYGMVAASQPNGGWTKWFPWSLPMLVLAAWPVSISTVIAGSIALAILVTLLACLEFSTREIR
jgi:hypothetical protein